MKDKIFTFLKTKLAGVPDAYLQRVADQYGKTITDEAQIATTITDGVIEVLKDSAMFAQQEGDRRAQTAQRTALEEFRKKHGLDENGNKIQQQSQQQQQQQQQSQQQSQQVGGDEVPAWAKGLLETVTKLTGTVEQANAAKVRESKMQLVKGKLKEKGVDELELDIWANAVNLDSETIDTDIESVADRYISVKQAHIKKRIESGEFTPNTANKPAGTDDELVKMMEESGKASQSKVGVTPLNV